MEIFKIVTIGIIGAILSITIRRERPEIALLVGIGTSVVIIFVIARNLSEIIGEFEKIISSYGITIEYFKTIVKIIGISYITKFASDICRDSGESAIASKIELAGKISIVVFSLPVIENFLELVEKALAEF